MCGSACLLIGWDFRRGVCPRRSCMLGSLSVTTIHIVHQCLLLQILRNRCPASCRCHCRSHQVKRRDMVFGTLEWYCKRAHFHVSNHTAVGFVMVTCVVLFQFWWHFWGSLGNCALLVWNAVICEIGSESDAWTSGVWRGWCFYGNWPCCMPHTFDGVSRSSLGPLQVRP